MKLLFILVLSFFLHFNAFGCDQSEELGYPEVTSLEDYEIDALLDEGEIYFLNGEFSKAESYFSQVILLCNERQENRKIRLCRAFFDRSLAHASMGIEGAALEDMHHLQQTLTTFQCINQNASSDEEYHAGGKPILGPNEIPARDCIERTETTISYIKDIVALVPLSVKWKGSFITALYVAEAKAKQCCRSGGIWKACLQPLLSKWMEMKEWERECRRSSHWSFLD